MNTQAYESHSIYNTKNYPIYLGTCGYNWHFYGNAAGHSACIALAGIGCQSSLFGDRRYFANYVSKSNWDAESRATFSLNCTDWLKSR